MSPFVDEKALGLRQAAALLSAPREWDYIARRRGAEKQGDAAVYTVAKDDSRPASWHPGL